MTYTIEQTTSEERMLAALSLFFGALVALIVWATQKDRSPFIRFQALQALAFDVLVVVLAMLSVGCFLIFGLLTFVASAIALIAAASDESGAVSSLLGLFFFPGVFPFAAVLPTALLGGLVMLVRIIAAASVLQGRDFRYPWLGERVEKFLAGQ